MLSKEAGLSWGLALGMVTGGHITRRGDREGVFNILGA